MSLVPLLRGRGAIRRDALFWHYPHYHPGGATPYGAIREGDWRLVEFYEDNHVELYNLRRDIGEKHNLAESEPALAKRLRDKLHAWRQRVGAQMPSPNPNYDPARAAANP
jgi:arylsulfatase A-like enzyme